MLRVACSRLGCGGLSGTASLTAKCTCGCDALAALCAFAFSVACELDLTISRFAGIRLHLAVLARRVARCTVLRPRAHAPQAASCWALAAPGSVKVLPPPGFGILPVLRTLSCCAAASIPVPMTASIVSAHRVQRVKAVCASMRRLA